MPSSTGARRAAMGAITMPGETASRVMRTTEAFAELAIGDPVCPPSPLNVEIGRDRRVAFARAELSALKAARGEKGATVNDVILAVAAGGPRGLLGPPGGGGAQDL